jgi:hypothetical protein
MWQSRRYTVSEKVLKSMCIKDISQIISSIATIIASGVAIWGVNAWKRKKDMEFAEEVLSLFYQAERAIEDIRNRVYDLAKGQSREPEKDETPEQKQARDRAYVVFKKIMEYGNIFDKLHTMRFRYMARFGKDKAGPFDEIKNIVDDIWVSAQRLTELWEEQATMQKIGQKLSTENQKEIADYEKVIWSSWRKEPDLIKSRIKEAVRDIEAICRPIIKGGWLVFFNAWWNK